jgi:hypothetical protein
MIFHRHIWTEVHREYGRQRPIYTDRWDCNTYEGRWSLVTQITQQCIKCANYRQIILAGHIPLEGVR